MQQFIRLYREAFGGLSKSAWLLAFTMLIHRSSAMVLPFLSVYLTEVLAFSLQQTGLILSIFGAGSLCGAFVGGWLTDRFGHFWVQVFSLVAGGSMFFVLINLQQFEYFAIGTFFLSLTSDILWPANSASVAVYAKPENITRVFSLNRMAMNLGFTIGPALGGILAAASYKWLFLADGFTCIAAGLFFYFCFRRRKGYVPAPKIKAAASMAVFAPFKDITFVLFTFFCCCFFVIFSQLFSTLPLYYRQVYALSESRIGGIFALDGLLVFSLEMLLVYLLIRRLPKSIILAAGLLCMSFAFVVLNLFQHVSVLYLSIFFLSIAEICVMPFLATITAERSSANTLGAYMGMYTISFSGAHVLAPYLSTSIVDHYGFETLWWLTGMTAVFTAAGFYIVLKRMEIRKPKPQLVLEKTMQ